jgi:transposase-like protein
MEKHTYTDEFKAEAVQLVTVCGLSPLRAAARIGLNEHTLNRWVAKGAVGSCADNAGEPRPQEDNYQAQLSEPERENIRMRQELASTRAERDRLWDFVHRVTALKIGP